MIFYLPELRAISEYQDCLFLAVEDGYRIAFRRDTQVDYEVLPAIFAHDEIDLAMKYIAQAVARGAVVEINSEYLKKKVAKDEVPALP